jgi:hypothetical protein
MRTASLKKNYQRAGRSFFVVEQTMNRAQIAAPRGKADAHVPVLFAGTLFLSATLLFLLQPMIGKMLLPRFGGVPAVWNTCMVFFQAVLLLGYVYAHVTTTWLGPRRQAAIHLGVLLLPLLELPIAVSTNWAPPAEANPVPWLLGLLIVVVGLPFFVIASTAPLLQKWFTATGHTSANDPYYLYAVSNLGSMLALLGYPLLIEPRLRLEEQSWLWSAGYGLLLLLLLLCALLVWRAPLRRVNPENEAASCTPQAAILWAQRRRWMALAFVPASWMLGVTSYLSTDVSSFPLLWTVPLALYLLSFVLVYSRLPARVLTVICWALPVVVLLQTFLMITDFTSKLGVVVPLHLLTFFVAALVFHGELARSRPPTQYLTHYYLWMSVGGVLGGLFNALLAPLLFQSIAEYPLVMVVACLLMPPLRPEQHKRWSRLLDLALPLLLGLLTFNYLWWLGAKSQGLGTTSDIGSSLNRTGTLRLIWQWGPPVAICCVFVSRPVRFGLGVGALFLTSNLYTAQETRYVLQERNFFGVLRVESLNKGYVAKLIHGTTLHGAQFRSDDPRLRNLPLLYYFPTGPIGQLFMDLRARAVVFDASTVGLLGAPLGQGPLLAAPALFSGRSDFRRPVGVIGLGAGALALYAQADQEFVFFEIDPAVVQIARDRNYFTYLADCIGSRREVLGDARLSLAQEPDGHYGLLVVDAFSSDAIPVHLLTQEAVQLYRKKLADGGILAFHISSKHLDLEPVLANLAHAESLICLVQHDDLPPRSELERRGKYPSDWVIMAKDQKDFGELAKSARWRPALLKPGQAAWTDDFSNVLSVLQWWQ